MTDIPQPPQMPDRPTDRPSGRGWKRAFLVLLAVNLAALGLVAGAELSDDGPRGHMVRDLGFGPFTDALSPEDRKALRDAFLEKVPDFRAARRDMRTNFAGILAALRTEPFDPAALRTAMDVMQAQNAERLDIGRSLIFDRVAGMTSAERAGFADRLEETMSRRSGDGS
jgi:uncharacterized membrane protein